jgi:hypothetical protein
MQVKFIECNPFGRIIYVLPFVMHPTFFERLKCEFKSENKGRRRVGVHSLVRNILGVEGVLELQDGD